jgi:hypothetical protein
LEIEMARPLTSELLRETADLIDKDIANMMRDRVRLRGKNPDGCNDDKIKEMSAAITISRNEAEKMRDRAEQQDDASS